MGEGFIPDFPPDKILGGKFISLRRISASTPSSLPGESNADSRMGKSHRRRSGTGGHRNTVRSGQRCPLPTTGGGVLGDFSPSPGQGKHRYGGEIFPKSTEEKVGRMRKCRRTVGNGSPCARTPLPTAPKAKNGGGKKKKYTLKTRKNNFLEGGSARPGPAQGAPGIPRWIRGGMRAQVAAAFLAMGSESAPASRATP